MVSAWFMDDSDEDQRLEHKKDPNVPVSMEQLKDIGVLYYNVSIFCFSVCLLSDTGWDYYKLFIIKLIFQSRFIYLQ